MRKDDGQWTYDVKRSRHPGFAVGGAIGVAIAGIILAFVVTAAIAIGVQVFGGSIPQTYRPAVAKGIEEARTRGYLAGFKVVDFRVRLVDGQYHDVDSSEMAFKIAGSLAFKDAMARASATILEPIMLVEVTAPDDMTGDIMSDLSQRRGRPQGMEAGVGNGTQLIKATVPMAEMLDYAPSLRSMTQGRASFHIEFSHYDEVPKQLQEKVIAEEQQAREEAS